MNELLSQIGIVVWGCKGGCRVFCDNRVVDVMAPDIHQTLKDIRSTITISRPGTDFYALEFTAQYKVFTQYRSSNDNGNGAFTAFTVYVPHKVRIQHIRALLNEMMNDYFKEYMNPLTFSPLSGKYDDINKYKSILSLHQDEIVRDISHQYHTSSTQDDRPQIVTYDDIARVDAYFESPYRQEFFSCQEVQFLHADIVNNPKKYEVNYLVTPMFISQVSDPIPESVCLPLSGKAHFTVSSFVVNGEDFTAVKTNVPLTAEDTVSLSLIAEHYNPRSWNNVTVSQLIADGVVRTVGRDYEIVADYQLEPKSYLLQVVNQGGVNVSDLRNHLYLSSATGNAKLLQKAQGGSFGFLLVGDEAGRKYQLEFSIDAFEDIKSVETSSIVHMAEIDPEEQIRTNATISLAVFKHTLKFKFPEEKPETILVKIESPEQPRAITLKPVKISWTNFLNEQSYLLPSRGFSQPKFEVSAEKFDTNLEEDVYVMTPKTVVAKLSFSGKLRDALAGDNTPIAFVSPDGTSIGGKKDRDACLFGLPYALRNSAGKLRIQDQLFDVQVEKGKILLKASLVVNEAEQAASIICHYNNEEHEIQLREKGYLLMPENAWFELSTSNTDGLRMNEAGLSDGIKVFVVKSKAKASVIPGNPHIPSTKTGEGDDSNVTTPEPPGGETEQKKQISFVGCEKLYAKLKQSGSSERKLLPLKDRRMLKIESDIFRLYNENEKELCSIIFPQSKYRADLEQDAANREKGFEVEWQSETECTVTYKPQNLWSRLIGHIDKKVIIGSLSVALVAVIGVLAYFLWPKTSYQMRLSFQTGDDTKITRVYANFVQGMTTSLGESLIAFTKNDYPEDSIKSIEEKTFTVFFEGGEKQTYLFGELFPKNGTSSTYRTIVMHLSGAQPSDTTIVVKVSSPGELCIASLSKGETCTIAACESVASKYPCHLDTVAKLAREIILKSDFDTDSVELLRNQVHLMKSSAVEQLLAEYSQMKDAQAEAEAVLKDYAKLKAKLSTLYCSLKDVQEIEEYRKEHPEVNKLKADAQKIADYRLFFEYPKSPIYSKIHQSSFTPQQWELIIKVLYNDDVKKKELNEKNTVTFLYLKEKANQFGIKLASK